MTDLEFVRAASPLVHRLGGAWFFTGDVAREGAKIGITDRFALYAAGRGGVLGDCDPSVVASAFAFFPPDIVKAKYLEGIAAAVPRECAGAYARGLATWGDRLFGDLPGAGRLTELGRKIADPVRPMGLPLFAGWRAVTLPDTPGARAALTFQVLRELRGDLHIHAVAAHELSPLQAILGKDGPDRARELHYPEPYPSPAEFADRRRAAEDLTDRLVAAAYRVLDNAERSKFVTLLQSAAQRLADSVQAAKISPPANAVRRPWCPSARP